MSTYSLIVKPGGYSPSGVYARIFAEDAAIFNGLVAIRHLPNLVAMILKLNQRPMNSRGNE